MSEKEKTQKKFSENKVSQMKIDGIPIWKHLKDGATKKETCLTNKDAGRFAELIGGRILWNFNKSKILNEMFPDINIVSANRMTGLGVGDYIYQISYKKGDGYGQKIAIFEVKHGNILIGRFQFEKYCRIITDPKNYFPKAEDVTVIFMMFEQIDIINMKASYSIYELDNELARKFLERLESDNFNMCFFDINGVFVETNPNGSFSIRVSVQDNNEGIEIRDNCVMDNLLENSDIGYYSRTLVRGFHKTVTRD